MTKPNDGGAAFPLPREHNNIGDFTIRSGMSLRDYFAAMALTREIHAIVLGPEEIAEYVYALADAMIKEREK